MNTATSPRCKRISPADHCPVCGHRGWCLMSADRTRVICPRVESNRRIGEAGWLHFVGEPIAGRRLEISPARPAVPRGADADLDRAYRAVLLCLGLSVRHREHLKARGLTDADVTRASYRSLPAGCRASVLRSVRDRIDDKLLLTVPGVITKDGPHGRYMTLGGKPGLLVPVRTVGGLIVGLIVRPDEQGDGGKYRWLSSAPAGPSPGARVHVPAGTEHRDRVVLVEGTLKADVASALAPGRSIIGLSGCSLTREALTVLHALDAKETLLALDADASSNVHVARAQVEGLKLLHAAGFREGLIRWNRALGKGLDDLLLTLRNGGPG
jgi:Domain of unknown function (DUF3854)